MKSTGARSSNELQRLDRMTGYQDSSPSYDRQGDMPYWNVFPSLAVVASAPWAALGQFPWETGPDLWCHCVIAVLNESYRIQSAISIWSRSFCPMIITVGSRNYMIYMHDPISHNIAYNMTVVKSKAEHTHHQIFNISHTKSQNLNVCRYHYVLQLFLPDTLNPGVKSRMNM